MFAVKSFPLKFEGGAQCIFKPLVLLPDIQQNFTLGLSYSKIANVQDTVPVKSIGNGLLAGSHVVLSVYSSLSRTMGRKLYR